MVDDLPERIGSISTELLTIAVPAALIALLGVIVIWRSMPRLRRAMGNWKIRRQIKKMGDRMLSELRLPDAVDGELQIDHLVLQGDRLILVDVKHFDGLIYGGEDMHQWTQVVNRKNFHFDNPLEQMQLRIRAVQSIVPDTRVDGVVLFAGNGRFPKRVPDGVLTLEDIPRRTGKTEVSDDMNAIWSQLREYRATGKAVKH